MTSAPVSISTLQDTLFTFDRLIVPPSIFSKIELTRRSMPVLSIPVSYTHLTLPTTPYV